MLSEEDIKRVRDEQEKRDEERRKTTTMPDNPYWQMIWRFLKWKS